MRILAHEHDFAGDASLAEQFVGVPCLGKRKSLRDERRDLVLVQKIEESDQVLSKHRRSQPHEGLDAIENHPFSAWEQPAGSDVHREDGERAVAMPATGTARRQSPSAQRAGQTIGHDRPARTERLTLAPDVSATDALKNNVHAVAGKAVDFCNEVLILIIDWDSAKIGNGRRASR